MKRTSYILIRYDTVYQEIWTIFLILLFVIQTFVHSKQTDVPWVYTVEKNETFPLGTMALLHGKK